MASPTPARANGAADAVFAGAGSTTVFAGGSASMVAPGAGALVVVNSGTLTCYFDGTGTFAVTSDPQAPTTSFGDTAGAYLFTEDTQLFFVGGGGDDTLAGSAGQEVVGTQPGPGNRRTARVRFDIVTKWACDGAAG